MSKDSPFLEQIPTAIRFDKFSTAQFYNVPRWEYEEFHQFSLEEASFILLGIMPPKYWNKRAVDPDIAEKFRYYKKLGGAQLYSRLVEAIDYKSLENFGLFAIYELGKSLEDLPEICRLSKAMIRDRKKNGRWPTPKLRKEIEKNFNLQKGSCTDKREQGLYKIKQYVRNKIKKSGDTLRFADYKKDSKIKEIRKKAGGIDDKTIKRYLEELKLNKARGRPSNKNGQTKK